MPGRHESGSKSPDQLSILRRTIALPPHARTDADAQARRSLRSYLNASLGSAGWRESVSLQSSQAARPAVFLELGVLVHDAWVSRVGRGATLEAAFLDACGGFGLAAIGAGLDVAEMVGTAAPEARDLEPSSAASSSAARTDPPTTVAQGVEPDRLDRAPIVTELRRAAELDDDGLDTPHVRGGEQLAAYEATDGSRVRLVYGVRRRLGFRHAGSQQTRRFSETVLQIFQGAMLRAEFVLDDSGMQGPPRAALIDEWKRNGVPADEVADEIESW